MQIGILQTGDSPEELHARYGSYGEMCINLLKQNHGCFNFQTFRVFEDEFPATATDYDGWLITGSRFSAYDDFAWITKLKDFIREIHATNRPLVGICFGHQIIAEALGGQVEKSDKGWGLGTDDYILNQDTPFSTDENTLLTLNIFHQDQVVTPPPQARVYASSDFCQYAGFVIGDSVLTIQAHPEFLVNFNRELLEARRGIVIPDKLVDRAMIQLEATDTRADSIRFAKWVKDFYLGSSPHFSQE